MARCEQERGQLRGDEIPWLIRYLRGGPGRNRVKTHPIGRGEISPTARDCRGDTAWISRGNRFLVAPWSASARPRPRGMRGPWRPADYRWKYGSSTLTSVIRSTGSLLRVATRRIASGLGAS